MDPRALEETAQLLVDHTIVQVCAVGWWSDRYDEPGAFVEYVELVMEDHATIRVSSDPGGGTFGLSLYEGAYRPFDAEGAARVHDLTPSLGDALAVPVERVVVHWATPDVAVVSRRMSDAAIDVRMEPTVVPTDLEVRLVGGRAVYFTCGSWTPEGELVGEQENVAIVVGDDEAERLRIAKWRGEKLHPR
jgi:hypothetical protein